MGGAEEGVKAVIERVQMMYEMIEHVPIEEDYLWFLYGREGKTLRLLEEISGCSLFSSTENSIISIYGTEIQRENCKQAIQRELDKIDKVPLGSSIYAVAGKNNGNLQTLTYNNNILWR